jgi:hypothetical protein
VRGFYQPWEGGGKEMKARGKTKAVAAVAVILLVMASAVPEVFAWGSATHAYIDDHLGVGKKSPLRNINEIYGGMAPDVFNYLFEHITDWYPYLYTQTHYTNFEVVWENACTKLGKSEAYGFVSHNNLWGADFWAHGIRKPDGTWAYKGYVIKKAEALRDMPKPEGLPELDDLFGSDVAFELYHNVVEAAVDILVANKDRTIGSKMASSAFLRSPELPLLLVKAYAKNFANEFNMDESAATTVILESEKAFRKTVILYGQALMHGENTSIQLVSEQLSEMAVSFLAGYGVTIPDSLKNQLPALTNAYIQLAITVCQTDFESEIASTIENVKQQLETNGISH